VLEVSRRKSYDDFREESDYSWPIYVQEASRILQRLTPQGLRRASVHPDGFLKLSIGPDNGVLDGQVRLHFWIPGRAGTRQPHGHPWHLASLVLAGTYNEYLPDLRATDSGRLRKFKVLYPPKKDERAGVHQVGTDVFESEPGPLYRTSKGGTHYLPAGPIHMSAPDISGGITLAVMSPRFKNEAYFFAPDSTPYSETIEPHDIEAIMEMVAVVRSDP
jgi:hypothetical protein